MSFDPLPLNSTEDALLVEQKDPIDIDDSTPIDVNLATSSSDNETNLNLDINGQLLEAILHEQKLTNLYLSVIVGDKLELE